jgi:hypothetical protein
LNLDEKLARASTYGDTGVKTMGELVTKVGAVVAGQLYGISLAQIYGLLQPNKPADIDRALSYLGGRGSLSLHTLTAGRPACYFPSGADLDRRVEVARRTANGGGHVQPPNRSRIPAG